MVKRKYDSKVVSSRIKECRKNKGWTQEQLAIQTGMSINSIKSYESGRRIPDYYNLTLLSEVFRVDKSYLLGVSIYRNQWDKYDSEHKEEINSISQEVKFYELAEELGYIPSNPEDYEESFNGFLEYTKHYKERKENQMKKSDVTIITGAKQNEIRENFETGEITVYAVTEADIEKAFEQLISRGMITE